jgi:hypothetical protein
MLAIRNQSRNMSPMDSGDCRVEVADRSRCIAWSLGNVFQLAGTSATRQKITALLETRKRENIWIDI